MGLVNQGWYDLNEGRNFPFADDASLADTETGSRLPNGLLVDLVLVVPRSIDPATVFVSEVAGFGSGLVIQFSVDDGGPTLVGVATIPATHERYDGYPINAVGDSGISGRLVIGQTEVVASISDQRFQFDLAAAQLATIAVRPRLGGVSGLVVEDFAGQQYKIGDDVTLVAGNHLTLSVFGSQITLDADGGVVIDDRFAGNTDQTGRTPVKSINGVQPDSQGNIQLEGTNCLSITAGVNRLTLSDICAEPCCGCEELERVQEGFSNIGDSQSELQRFLNTLESKIATLEQNFARSTIPQV